MGTVSYKDAGVDIDAGNQFVENIKPLVKSTFDAFIQSSLKRQRQLSNDVTALMKTAIANHATLIPI